MGSRHGKLRKLVLGVLAAGFAAKLVAVLWALDRGFEIGDEGYNLLNLNHPEDAPVVFQFYRLLTPFGDRLRFGVVDARILRLAAELLGSAALLSGVLAWARARVFARSSSEGFDFALVCLTGALIGTGSRSLTYNDVTNFCTYIAVGALFHLAALPAGDDARRSRTLAALAAGFAGGLQLGVKFPTALALAVLAVFALGVVFHWLTPRERLRVAAVYAGGIVLAIALYLVASGGLGPLFAELRVMPEVARNTGYDPLRLLLFYAKGEVVTMIHVAVGAAVFGAAFALLRAVRVDADRATAGALACAAAALAFGVRMFHPFFLDPTLVHLTAFLALATALLGTWAQRAHRTATGDGKALAPLLLLIALPFAEIAGTNVPISERLPTHALPLFAVLGVLSLDLRARAGRAWAHAVLAAALLASTSALVVRQQWIAPYGLPSDIRQQRHAVTGLPGVRVDAATKTFLESVAAGMREAGFRPGDPVLALDFMPGLVFFLEGTSPGFTLYVFDKPEFNCLNVNRLYAAPPYLILGRPMSREQAACLETFSFPDDFREVRAIRFPYEAVYAKFGAADFSHVHLYAPRDRQATR